MGDERRRAPRVECDARVDYGSPDEVILDHKLENLSLGGACLAVSSAQPIGTRVVLFISFPDFDAETIEVEGEVVWSNDQEPRDVGIRFGDVTEHARTVLQRYIQRQLVDGQDPE